MDITRVVGYPKSYFEYGNKPQFFLCIHTHHVFDKFAVAIEFDRVHIGFDEDFEMASEESLLDFANARSPTIT